MEPSVLIVDDEPVVRGILERLLRQEGFRVITASTGEEGLQMIKKQLPNVLILDLNLPDISGEEICSQLRKEPHAQAIPILILTGRNTVDLPATCLEGGADDYLSKPFDNRELVARIRALLRRPGLYLSSETVIQEGSIQIYPAEHCVVFKGRVIKNLSPKEFDILFQIVLHTPQVVKKETLAQKVWEKPREAIHARTLDVHVRRIRKKLGGRASEHLKTIPTLGFQWLADKQR